MPQQRTLAIFDPTANVVNFCIYFYFRILRQLSSFVVIARPLASASDLQAFLFFEHPMRVNDTGKVIAGFHVTS